METIVKNWSYIYRGSAMMKRVKRAVMAVIQNINGIMTQVGY